MGPIVGAPIPSQLVRACCQFPRVKTTNAAPCQIKYIYLDQTTTFKIESQSSARIERIRIILQGKFRQHRSIIFDT